MVAPSSGERLPATALGPFTPDDIARYAVASGDSNPIHLDPAAAVAAGLAGQIVHGMLVMAHMVRIAEAWRADAVVMTTRVLFVQPIGVGEGLTVDGRVVAQPAALAARQWTVRLTARTAADTIAAVVEVHLAAAAPTSPAPSRPMP